MTLMRWTNSCFYPLAYGQLVFLCVVLPKQSHRPARSSLPGLLPGTRSNEQLMLIVGLRKEGAPRAVSLGPESGPDEERSLCWDQPSVEHRVKGARPPNGHLPRGRWRSSHSALVSALCLRRCWKWADLCLPTERLQRADCWAEGWEPGSRGGGGTGSSSAEK